MKHERTLYAATASIKDANDCSVRALAVALGISVDFAGMLFTVAGRRIGKGTEQTVSAKLHEWLAMREVTVAGLDLQTFAERARGTYVCHKKRHAFAVVEGIVHDWEGTTKPSTRLERAWKITDETRAKVEELKAKFEMS